MREAKCLECRASFDPCWRWCPECGSIRLLHPGGQIDLRWGEDFSVDWEMDEGRFDDRPEVGSTV